MGTALIIFAAFGGVLSTIAIGLLKDEIAAWLPRLVDALLIAAVRRVPVVGQERYAEEWRSHINEYPGKLSQLTQSIKITIASFALKEKKVETWSEFTWRTVRSLDRCSTAIALCAPLYAVVLTINFFVVNNSSLLFKLFHFSMVLLSIAIPTTYRIWLRKYMIRQIDRFPNVTVP